jgi:hypothetical protein
VIAREFDSSGSDVSEVSERSDQPRCCGKSIADFDQRASPAAGGSSLFKMCASAEILKTDRNIKSLIILHRIKWTAVHAFSEGKSSNNKLRIFMPNV